MWNAHVDVACVDGTPFPQPYGSWLEELPLGRDKLVSALAWGRTQDGKTVLARVVKTLPGYMPTSALAAQAARALARGGKAWGLVEALEEVEVGAVRLKRYAWSPEFHEAEVRMGKTSRALSILPLPAEEALAGPKRLAQALAEQSEWPAQTWLALLIKPQYR